jgi:hypothetical protein
VTEDISALAKVGVDHVFVTIPYAVHDIKEWIDAAAALYAAVRESGV